MYSAHILIENVVYEIGASNLVAYRNNTDTGSVQCCNWSIWENHFVSDFWSKENSALKMEPLGMSVDEYRVRGKLCFFSL